MTLRLVLEHASNTQRIAEKTFLGGQMTIGRGDECDWQIDDPDQYVSRKHCVITDEDGILTVIDASTGGVFVDGATTPLGAGNSVALEHQMRLRLGDFVIRVELQGTTSKQAAPPSAKSNSLFDFGTDDSAPSATSKRPDELPPKFGVLPGHSERHGAKEDKPPPKPLHQDGAFDLDLIPQSSKMPKDDVKSASSDRNSFSGGGGYFGNDESEADSTENTAPQQVPKPPPAPWPPIEVFPEPENAETPPPIVQPIAPPPQQSADTRQNPQNDIAALYKGMGLDPALAKDATPQELEAIGARFKEMVDGVMFLLRTRAEEKVKVRVAQTIISNADVNPLKFLASSEDAILALIRGRGDSYLPGDKAVTGAYRDLADHQVRTWQALQTALRRMVDRFDPEVIEREIEGAGFLEKLVAGGRNAKLWQTYQNRYREIAKAAEEKFLGEVGADFRDAYEEKRNRK